MAAIPRPPRPRPRQKWATRGHTKTAGRAILSLTSVRTALPDSASVHRSRRPVRRLPPQGLAAEILAGANRSPSAPDQTACRAGSGPTLSSLADEKRVARSSAARRRAILCERRRTRRLRDVRAADLQEEMAEQRVPVPADPTKTAATQRTSRRAERANKTERDARAASKKQAASVGYRAPARGGGESRGVLPRRATTNKAATKRDARAA